MSACLISFASWLSGRFPTLAGFIVALPIATMMVLPMSRIEHGEAVRTAALAKGILLAVPITITFLLPFVFAERLGLSFWQSYGLGVVLLMAGFFAHRVAAAAW